jgi:hypothetical protein
MEPDSKASASVSQALAPDDEFYDAEVVSGGEGFEPIDFEHYYGNIKQWTFETVFMPLLVEEARAILARHRDSPIVEGMDYSNIDNILQNVRLLRARPSIVQMQYFNAATLF